MLPIETAASFFIFNLSLLLIPSAELVIVLNHSITRGWHVGVVFIIGVCFALVFQVLLMAYGISEIIQTSEYVFNVLKLVGVLYLAYLSWVTFFYPISSVMKKSDKSSDKLSRIFGKGVLLNVASPMTPLFLLFIIPNYVDYSKGQFLSQSLLLGLVLIAAVFIFYSSVGVIADKMGDRLFISEKTGRIFQRVAGVAIACFAVFLGLATQSM